MRTLTEQQAAAVEKFKRLRVGALFMACGTGKTQTAAAIVNGIDDADALFWLCPCRTIENLREELAKCELSREPQIIGIESIGQSDRIFLEVKTRIESTKRAILVCDESLKIKNIAAKRTKRLLLLSQAAHYRLILNGTPITKNILDIYPQMEFLSPKIFNATYRQFKTRYCVLGQKKLGKRVLKEWVKSFANIEHLQSVIAPYVFQCDLKLSVAREHKTEYFFLSDSERERYEELKEAMIRETEEAKNDGRDEGFSFLKFCQKAQQEYSCAAEKFECLKKFADSDTVVFCKFIRSFEAVKRAFPNLSVLTYGKSSIGLNLQDKRRIVFFDKTFDYAHAEQSEYRIFRTGQTRDCEYIHFHGNVGLENLFDDVIERKVNLIQHFKKNAKKVLAML